MSISIEIGWWSDPMRVIPTRIHSVMGVMLIAVPWLLGFAAGGAETWVAVILGAGTIDYSPMTDYEPGVVSLPTMPTHLAFDAVAGSFLAVSPWMFGFADFVWVPHVVSGMLGIGAAEMTQWVPTRVPGGPARTSI